MKKERKTQKVWPCASVSTVTSVISKKGAGMIDLFFFFFLFLFVHGRCIGFERKRVFWVFVIVLEITMKDQKKEGRKEGKKSSKNDNINVGFFKLMAQCLD